jgi:ApaG protein
MDNDAARRPREQRRGVADRLGITDSTFLLLLLGACFTQYVLVHLHDDSYGMSIISALHGGAATFRKAVENHNLVSAAERRVDTAAAVEEEEEDAAALSSPPREIQPDEVRLEAGTSNTPKLQCDAEKLLRHSTTSTTEGITTTVGSQAQEGGEGSEIRSWAYFVEFRNDGPLTVQMLTRHWIFIDANGAVQEIKGPGAVGATPILGPGETYAYQSGTRLSTAVGSMAGSFQFEVLANPKVARGGGGGGSGGGDSVWWGLYPPGTQFNAPVDRLALMPPGKGGANLVPSCPKDQSFFENGFLELACTSVFSTQRIIAGATSQFLGSREGKQAYRLDVQINNARTEPCTFFTYNWKFLKAGDDAEEGTSEIIGESSGIGIGGDRNIGVHVLAGGASFRFMATFEFDQSQAPPGVALSMIASGFFEVALGDRRNDLDKADLPLFNVQVGDLACRRECGR